MNSRDLMKKNMTKKKYLETMKKNRSTVSRNMNTGTITMRSEKDYERTRANREERKEITSESQE